MAPTCSLVRVLARPCKTSASPPRSLALALTPPLILQTTPDSASASWLPWIVVGILMVFAAWLAFLFFRARLGLDLTTDAFSEVSKDVASTASLPVDGGLAKQGARLNRSLNRFRGANIKAQLHDQALASLHPEEVLEAAARHTHSLAAADGIDCASVSCIRFYSDRQRLAQSHTRLADGTNDLAVLAFEDPGPEGASNSDPPDHSIGNEPQVIRFSRGSTFPAHLANLERLLEQGNGASPVAINHLDVTYLRRPSDSAESGNELLGALALGRNEIDAPALRLEETPNLLALSRSIGHALATCERKLAIEHLANDALLALARAADATSSYTRGHSERVAQLAVRVGKQLELPPSDLEKLRRAALVHDLGSVAIPQRLLDQKDAYDEEDRALMRPHIEHGLAVLEPLGAFQEILPIVAQHHEWWNGDGYPKGLSREGIDPLARVLTVVDVYEAMTSTRPYRTGMEPERALAHLRSRSGAQFEPRVVDALAQCLRLD